MRCLRTTSTFLLIASLFLLFLLSSLRAQSPAIGAQRDLSQQDPAKTSQPEAVYDSSTVLRTTTRLVVVDVVAKDKNGEPVDGLVSDDFKVLENGKPQKIRVFSFQRSEPAPHNLPPLPANVFTNVPRHNYNGALNVILMDGINTSFTHVADMRRSTLDFLRKLSRDEPVAIYGLNQKLELLQDFTTGVPPLEKTAHSRPAAAAGTFSLSQFREIPESETRVASFMAWYPQPPQECLSVLVTLKALHWIARSLSGYPGRKNLIWIADSFPFGIYTQISQTTDTCLSRYSGELSETAETILDNQIAVYPVVAVGLEDNAFDPASSTLGLVGGQSFANQVASQAQRQAYQIAAVNNLASQTGGQAFKNRNDLDMAIRSSIDDGSAYYTLGYYPDNKDWNGAFRDIHVKVDREGVQLRHRSGYFATSGGPVVNRDPKHRGHSMSEALALEAPTATSVLFEAALERPSPETGNKILVKFAIDPHGLAFEKPSDQLEHASVDCVVRAYSVRGAIVKTASSTMNAKLTPATFIKVMQGSFPCEQRVDLAPGTYLLRLGVIDNSTGLLGTANGKVTVF